MSDSHPTQRNPSAWLKALGKRCRRKSGPGAPRRARKPLASMILGMPVLIVGAAPVQGAEGPESRSVIADKTLVAWVYPANLSQRGGGVLTLENAQGEFDAVVFGEIQPGRWMAGSNGFSRTGRDQDKWAAETAGADTAVQIAIVYEGKHVTIYRNGQPYADYTMENVPATFSRESVVLMGLRHLDAGEPRLFAGAIEDARIYNAPLDAKTIASLRPNKISDPKPLAWWSFQDGRTEDRMGTFPNAYLVGGARIADGRLHLDGEHSYMMAGEMVPRHQAARSDMNRAISTTRKFREKLLDDPYRPGYHFVALEGVCLPFDPNGAIFWKGRYHLFYIFQDERGHCWGHASSKDLVHWRRHPTGLYPGEGDVDRGMFSGNCFINKKGEATMLYHGVGAGNCIATSAEEELNNWTKLPSNPIIPNPGEGTPEAEKYASWDPHGWLEGDTYYGIFGGKRPALFKADTLDKWRYVGDLLAHSVPGVSINEDVSCPDFFKLGDKHMLLCISHRLGCRYYLGEWKNERFYPEFHEKMSWVDNSFFAPESLLDDQGRRIMWAWIFDLPGILCRGEGGWSGTMSLPRVLWLDEDGMLRMRPPEELALLRYHPKKRENLTVQADSELSLDGIEGNSIELAVEVIPGSAKQCGVKVCCSPGGEEQTLVYYDAAEKKLAIDTRKSSLGEGPKTVEAGPFELRPDEPLRLQVFVDKSVVEVFANDRQAAMRRIYPTREDSVSVVLFSKGGAVEAPVLEAWDMMPSNPY